MAIAQVRELVYELLLDRMEEERPGRSLEAPTEGRWTHDYPITTLFQTGQAGTKVKYGLPSGYTG